MAQPSSKITAAVNDLESNVVVECPISTTTRISDDQKSPSSTLCSRRQKQKLNTSPPSSSGIYLEAFAEPLSPASSSSASQTNGGDSTFEPSIDMMVNDFDDEQTLLEEEALAEQESHDIHDEIATLQEESEMPLEQLLAKYRNLDNYEESKNDTVAKHSKQKDESSNFETCSILKAADAPVPKDDEKNCSNIDSCKATTRQMKATSYEENLKNYEITSSDDRSQLRETSVRKKNQIETNKQRRSHLMELYPEKFSHITRAKQTDENECYEEDEEGFDYVKRTIMVGSAFQAVIPVGLFKYGDVLPYENEDKLIWEPSQVSEKEVEDYLIKVRDVKPSLSDDEPTDTSKLAEVTPSNINDTKTVQSSDASISSTSSPSTVINGTAKDDSDVEDDSDTENVIYIKDNEQALHLLVQCGYDFKEAIRRKRLNALPLTGSMSIWSEEECQKFEEGIRKYGKDFLKIRQNQVRTRSMRELVQFYYLWKKTERHDQDFPDSDNVDLMDMIIDEGEYNISPTSNKTSSTSQASSFRNKKAHAASSQKNFSIMNESKRHLSSVSTTSATSITSTAFAMPTNSGKITKSAALKKSSKNQSKSVKRRRRGGASAVSSSTVNQVDSNIGAAKNGRTTTNCK